MSKVQDQILWVKHRIDLNGFKQYDKRYKRYTESLVGCVMDLDSDIIQELQKEEPIGKYIDDVARMAKTLNYIIEEFKEDPDSRRLVVINTDDYLKVYPCFLTMQFVLDDGKVGVIVYQRSSDIEKMFDDLVFFAHIVRQFETGTGQTVDYMSIVYGNVHYETKNPQHLE